jgi:hypothetical protein
LQLKHWSQLNVALSQLTDATCDGGKRVRHGAPPYDDFATTQQAWGVTAQAVYRGIADPNGITVTHEFETLEAAQVFLLRDELKAAMQAARVSGTPTIWFTTKV